MCALPIAKGLLDVAEAVPLEEVHEDDRAVHQVEGVPRELLEAHGGQLDERRVGAVPEPRGGVPEHPAGDVGPEPVQALLAEGLADAADAAADLEDDVDSDCVDEW